MSDIPQMEDADEAYCEGDVDLADVDPDELDRLTVALERAQNTPEEDRPMVMLGVLHEMYGDDLEVL